MQKAELTISGLIKNSRERYNLNGVWGLIDKGKGKIRLSEIAEGIVLSAAMGSPSLRQHDQIMRMEKIREELGAGRRQVCSDTTMSRVIEHSDSMIFDTGIRKVSETLRGEGKSGVEICGHRYKVGIVDGSYIGGQYMSVVAMPGKVGTILGANLIEKYGKELAASFSLLKEVNGAYGGNVMDLTLGDGLYACQGFWTACREIGSYGIVKTDEATLNAIKDANGIFDSPTIMPGVEYTSGIDHARMCAYKAWTVGNIRWMDTDTYLKAARIEETHLKGKLKGQTIRFWMLSQNQELSACDLRTLGHLRWFIENNGFRSLNDQCHTKHIFSHKKEAALSFAKLHFIAFMIVNAYRDYLEQFKEQLKGFWDHGTFPLRLLRRCLLSSLQPGELNTA